ncbi:hypothetical protein VNO77_00087 [Canavalia gladiata]|uniref:Uncharacterized protein n=1 Tax=Canavalia gladiata TaxID=3824 RepID=A0AAN9MV55_CANGL
MISFYQVEILYNWKFASYVHRPMILIRYFCSKIPSKKENEDKMEVSVIYEKRGTETMNTGRFSSFPVFDQCFVC